MKKENSRIIIDCRFSGLKKDDVPVQVMMRNLENRQEIIKFFKPEWMSNNLDYFNTVESHDYFNKDLFLEMLECIGVDPDIHPDYIGWDTNHMECIFQEYEIFLRLSTSKSVIQSDMLDILDLTRLVRKFEKRVSINSAIGYVYNLVTKKCLDYSNYHGTISWLDYLEELYNVVLPMKKLKYLRYNYKNGRLLESYNRYVLKDLKDSIDDVKDYLLHDSICSILDKEKTFPFK